jgi:hypothetical protein
MRVSRNWWLPRRICLSMIATANPTSPVDFVKSANKMRMIRKGKKKRLKRKSLDIDFLSEHVAIGLIHEPDDYGQ